METFAEVGARDGRTLPAAPSSLDSWGNIPDPRFGATGAIVPEAALA
jgi:2,3-dihydroxy-p-cumate/2,3-dihydroxybenzoate 3,4-dioxygenase